MAKKVISWKTKGMNRDLSVSAFNPEFAFENMNLRLQTNEGNTLLSWVNEKGTSQIQDTQGNNITLAGTPIGTAVLNRQLVVFTHNSSNAKPDYIYVLKYNDSTKANMNVQVIYNGNLNFSVDYPLETLVSFEADYIQKVYWTDGLNQPRIINIAATAEQRAKWEDSSTCFDFIPTLQMNETVTITRSQGGMFAPGVIQYCFTYVNKYGQQSNVVWASTLYYISHLDRGASPEDKVSNSFNIQIKDIDTNFDYLRLYSIQRTSLNDVAYVKLLEDIPTSKAQIIDGHYTLTYLDAGNTGAVIDPDELIYVGGKEIAALTMTVKDQTMFLGNLTTHNTQVTALQDYYDNRRNSPNDSMGISFKQDSFKQITLEHCHGIYSHTNLLTKSLREISTFKGGETYRLGFQLQKKTGEWTDPIFMKDVVNPYYPKTELLNDNIQLSYAEAQINISNISGVDYSQYKKIRPVIVYPSMADRTVLCQGVINPTVFNIADRMRSAPFAQASWFFRPYVPYDESSGDFITPDIQIESYPIPEGQTPDMSSEGSLFRENSSEVYVLMLEITDEDILEGIRAKKYIVVQERRPNEQSSSGNFSGSRRTERYSFKGMIPLGNHRYLFIRDASEGEWPVPYGNLDSSEDSLNYVDTTFLGTNSRSFSMYNNLGLSNEMVFYYTKPESWDASYNTYVFKFYVLNEENSWYKVIFNSIGSAEYYINTGTSSGNTIRYKHYDSLYCEDDVVGDDSTSLESAKQIEIQGATNLYKDPFTKKQTGLGGEWAGVYAIPENREPETSTQFFVDQSIVTFNSPDIEFDESLQAFGLDDVNLRIIGAIPITASVSSHSIQASAMLEEGHNVDRGTDLWVFHFGTGERDINAIYNNININSAKRLVSEYLWNDTMVFGDADKDDKVRTAGFYDYLIHPWQLSGSLNTDNRTEDVASSVLQTKKESSLFYSFNTEYISNPLSFNDVNSQLALTENSEVFSTRLKRQSSESSEIIYYANVDTLLYNNKKYHPRVHTHMVYDGSEYTKTGLVSMKYKSTSHAVVAINSDSNGKIHIMPSYGNIGKYTGIMQGKTLWNDKVDFSQEDISTLNPNLTSKDFGFLWLGELYRTPLNRFGGTSKEAILNNTWVACGETVNLLGGAATIRWTDGDTFFQRYDCLKTYPFTNEDENQLVEILSFLCETHVNIDGRYDRNRGQRENHMMSPKNFNVLNPVYSQQNNYFTYRKPNFESQDKLVYPNQVFYTKTKTSGADVDLFTNVTLASILELDGDKGQLNSLQKFNDKIIAFQDFGISQIQFNENTILSTEDGVPVEIANSGKVQGKTYISENIGCSNKWSICKTPSGIYFMDSNSKDIYLFNGQLQNLSAAGGFNSWAKKNIVSGTDKWTPNFDKVGFNYTKSAFIAHYDRLSQDVLWINKDTALAWNEKLGVFTSFYDYGDTPWFCNLEDTGIWISRNGTVWKHREGKYCKFFGVNKPFWTTLVGNPEPTLDKTFTNLEFRACVEGEGTGTDGGNGGLDVFDYTFDYTFHPEGGEIVPSKYVPHLPFDYLETWNEYQHGISNLENRNGHSLSLHHTGLGSALNRKFRIWRCDIPCNNYPMLKNKYGLFIPENDSERGIYRKALRPRDRMRNPWIYLKLQKNASEETNKTEIHDIEMTYFT